MYVEVFVQIVFIVNFAKYDTKIIILWCHVFLWIKIDQ